MNELRKVIGGVGEPLEWLMKGIKPVEPGVAVSRAGTCVTCPKNGVGPLTEWFTKKAAWQIRRSLETRHKMNLTTPYDAALGVCEACYCPLPLKVHEPITLVRRRLREKTRKELWDRCWILREISQLNGTEET